MLIGICGLAGSGKDEVANVLIEKHNYIRNKFADPLYEMISTMTGYTVSQLQDRTLKEKPIGWLDSKTPRQLLQTLGTDWGRDMVCSDVWIRSVQKRVERAAEDGRPSVITDLRFDNEAEWVHDMGGEVWRVVRDVPQDVACQAEHKSESGVEDGFIDRIIDNAGSLDELRGVVAQACVDAGIRCHSELGYRDGHPGRCDVVRSDGRRSPTRRCTHRVPLEYS